MDFCAIISEFNPFHSGHEYLIAQAKKKTQLPVLCLMSGNFVQRGEPAICDKYFRARCAINAGADMVAELPVCYAMSSAENFARGAIKILKELGCTTLVIGTSHTNIDDYYSAITIKQKSLVDAMHSELNKGQNYSKTLIDVTTTQFPKTKSIFSDASNILALEYIRQIKVQNVNITPILVKRTDGGYNTENPTGKFANASYIRAQIENNNYKEANKFIPSYAKLDSTKISNNEGIKSITLYNLQKCSANKLSKFYDYSEGLPNLLSNSAKKAVNFDELVKLATSKRYRRQRIQKLCYYPSIELTAKSHQTISRGRPIVKMLAIKKDKKKFLSVFNKNHQLVIVSYGDYKKLTKAQVLSAKIDLAASNLYNTSKQELNSDIKTGTLFCQ